MTDLSSSNHWNRRRIFCVVNDHYCVKEFIRTMIFSIFQNRTWLFSIIQISRNRKHSSEISSKWANNRRKSFKKTFLFNDDEFNSKIIIVTIYHIFFRRHDFATQRVWKINRKRFFSTKTNRLFHELDFKWFDNLQDCFNMIIMNETHFLQFKDSENNCAMRWF